jgi:arylsulfatase A-like enzyme/cytochrome c-type biogenesis protein CcmH/NrfG
LALAATLAACGEGRERSAADPAAASPPAALPADRPPIVLISIDTLRSDRLPAYGYDGVETPAIDALRRESILFERAYSHTPLTLPSHVSVLTGTLPTSHGVRDNQGYAFVPGQGPYLPRDLGRYGYATGAAVSAAVLAGASGLAAGWDLYDDRVPAIPGVALGGVARPGTDTLAAAEPWLRSVAGEPFLLFFHLFEPHLPYDPPEPFASRYASAYDGEIAAADRVVGELFELLRQLELWDRSAIVLMSDHGEGLGDHGEEEHGIFLYREALQVPLLLKLPGGRRAGERVAAPVGLVDLYPTLLGLAGVVPAVAAPAVAGVSLLGAGAGPGGKERAIYAETFYPRLHYGWSELRSLIRGRFHYIEAPRPELYNLAVDPRERRDLVRSEPAVAAELGRGLVAHDRALELPAPADDETRRRLAALGYLSGGANPAGELADPKAKITSLADLRRGFDHYRRGEPAQAVPAFRAVLAENPGIVDGWEYLALSLRRLGRLDESAAAYRGALAAAGDAPRLIHELARTLSEAGDQSAAGAELERLLALAPGDAAGHETLGLVRLRQRRWEDARAASERAVDLDPGRVEAWNNLGVALYSAGRGAEALDAWERAVELDPDLWDVLYNLGTSAAGLGRAEQARRALERFVAAAPPERYGADIRRARALLARLPG